MLNLDSNELISSLKFCVIDLETTGGNPTTEKIIEIGMVKIENKKITEERSFLINPEKEIPEFVQKLTGIKKSTIEHSPKIEEIIDEVVQFIGADSILVAHNTSFDIPFLNGVLKNLKMPALENKVLCTNIMTKYLIPDIMSSNLNYMCQIFEISHSQAHRAIEDAKATGLLLLKYLDIFEAKNLKKINQLYYPRNKFELDRIIIESPNDFEVLIQVLDKESRACVLTIKGENGVILGILPIRNPQEEKIDILKFVENFKWNQIAIRLTGPFIEGIFYFNSNFIKIPDKYREKTIHYLQNRYQTRVNPSNLLQEFDFIISPHLITGQFIVYSFLNFSPFSNLIFKYPSHKKKFHQFLLSQIAKFENNQKGKRKIFIQNEIKELFLTLFQLSIKENPELFLSLKMHDIKDESKAYLDRVEKLAFEVTNYYHFPSVHF
jgi:DNA polymerase-3 subunit epsilon